MVLEQSQKGHSFSLFTRSRTTNHLQIQALKQIQSPPIADALQPAYIQSKVKELFLLTIGAYEENEDSNRAVISAQDVDRLYGAREYLSQNYLLPLTLEEISKKFLLNDFKLKSGFKKLYGITVFKYIQQLRMEHAATLVQNGGYTIGEIAEIIGYNSDAAFIRSFKKHNGYTPGKRNVC